MLARFGFSVATDIEPLVLIVDEVLSVADAAFQQKSMIRVQEMIDDGASGALVPHNLHPVRASADRAIWLHKRTIRRSGAADELVAAHEASDT